MNSLKVFGVIAMTVGVLLQPARSSAHHSFAAEFDGNKCRDFTGVLTKLEWAKSSRVLLHGRQGRERQGRELVVSDLCAHHAQARRERSAAVPRPHRQGSVGQGMSGPKWQRALRRRRIVEVCVGWHLAPDGPTAGLASGAVTDETSPSFQRRMHGRAGVRFLSVCRRPSRTGRPTRSSRCRRVVPRRGWRTAMSDFSGHWLPNGAGQGVSGRFGVNPAARGQFDPKVTPEETAGVPAVGTGQDEVDDADGSRTVEVIGQLHATRRCPRSGCRTRIRPCWSTRRTCWRSCTRFSTTGASFTRTADPLPKNPEPWFHGNSSARWEGDTLVVESIGIDEQNLHATQRVVSQ